jgi:hypothetical protein
MYGVYGHVNPAMRAVLKAALQRALGEFASDPVPSCSQARTPGERSATAYARAATGQAAAGAARTATFLSEQYARITRRRGEAIAQAAVARSIMIIAWHLFADPQARYRDLGPDFYASRINRDKKIRNHVRGLQALGLTVTITAGEQAA